MPLTPSNIGYIGIGADGRPITKNWGWTPFGIGCSGGCEGCFACKLSKRFAGQIAKRGTGGITVIEGNPHERCCAKCKDGRVRWWQVCKRCAAFEPHFHRERLKDLSPRQAGRIILCDFTNDRFDDKRNFADVCVAMRAQQKAPQHIYVMLTHRPRTARIVLSRRNMRLLPNEYLGVTIRNQADADARLPEFLGIEGNLWISHEPAREEIRWPWALWNMELQGVIVGHDNRRGAPGTDTLKHIRSTVQQCRRAAAPVLVKQLWLWQCPECHSTFPEETNRLYGCTECPAAGPGELRARLFHDPEAFPPDLRYRNLPWSAPRDT